MTASDDPSAQWAYVRYGDRLEVIQIVNAGDISEYTDAVMEDVRRQYTGQGNSQLLVYNPENGRMNSGG